MNRLGDYIFQFWVAAVVIAVIPLAYYSFEPIKDLIVVIGVAFLAAYFLAYSFFKGEATGYRISLLVLAPLGIGIWARIAPLAPFAISSKLSLTAAVYLACYAFALIASIYCAIGRKLQLLRFLVVMGIFQALLVITQFCGFDPISILAGSSEGYWRVYGTLGNPSLVGAFLLPIAILSLDREVIPTWWVRLGTFALITIGIVVTGSRFIGVLFPLLVVWYFINKPKHTRVILPMAIVLVISVFLVASLMGKNTSSISGRFVFWRSAIALIAERPVTGWSSGHFEINYPAIVSTLNIDFVPTSLPDHAHNDWLEWAVELGVFPVSLILGVLLYQVWQGWQSNRTVALAVMGMIIVAAWDSILHITPLALLFWTLVGVLGFRSGGRPLPAWIVRVALGIVLLNSLVMVPVLYQRFQAHLDAGSALRYLAAGEFGQSISELERAVVRAPSEGVFAYELAELKAAQGKSQQALELAQQAALTYADLDLFILQARLYWQMGRYEESKRILEWLTKVFPAFKTADEMLMQLQEVRGDRL